jgi:N-acetylglucosaminyldiphosphoundecaprenol N-acetyl-beta-D-mannosaminyltransferase
VRVGAIEVCAISEADVLDHVAWSWRDGLGGSIITANVDIVRMATRDSAVAELISRAELVVADGMPVVWAGRLAGAHVPERIAGSTLVFSLTGRAEAESRSVYLLGGDTGIPEEAARVLSERYPRLKVAGTDSPPFGFETDEQALRGVIERVVDAQPDLVLVGLGFPKQERLIEQLRAVLPAAWYLGCGAGIPMAAGQFRRASTMLQRLGAEWLHRLALEPRRLARRYLRDDLPFALVMLAGGLRSRFGSRRAR